MHKHDIDLPKLPANAAPLGPLVHLNNAPVRKPAKIGVTDFALRSPPAKFSSSNTSAKYMKDV